MQLKNPLLERKLQQKIHALDNQLSHETAVRQSKGVLSQAAG